MNFEDLTAELQEKAKACETPEDVIALAKEQGYELNDDELDSVSGGEFWGCPENDCEAAWCPSVE